MGIPEVLTAKVNFKMLFFLLYRNYIPLFNNNQRKQNPFELTKKYDTKALTYVVRTVKNCINHLKHSCHSTVPPT